MSLLSYLESITFKDYVESIRKKKIIFFVFNLIASILLVFWALSLNNYYKSSALIYSDSSDKLSQLSSQYSGLASLAGINLPTDGSTNNIDIAISSIRSKELFKTLVDKDENLLPNLLAYKSLNKETGEIIYDKKEYDVNNKTWIRKPKGEYGVIPTYIEGHEKFIEDVLRVSKDIKTNFVSVSIEHISPKFAYSLLENLISELNFTSRQKQILESNKALDFLELELLENNIESIDDAIASLVESELKSKMLANINEEFLVKYIDKPFVPEKKTRPSRSIICIIGFLLSLLISSIYVIYSSYQNEKLKGN